MANSEIINLIVQTTADSLVYMLPIIGIMAGINFIASFLLYVTLGLGKRTFKG